MSSELYFVNESHETALNKRLVRLKRSAKLLATVGVRSGLSLLYDRAAAESGKSEKTHLVSTSRFRFPFELTASHGDIGMFFSVSADEEYRLPREIRPLINGKPIIDMGANIGVSAAYFASRYPESFVFAVEPHPRNLALLKRNAVPYGGQIDVCARAVSPQPGTIYLQNPEMEEKGHYGSYRFSPNGILHAEDEIHAEGITPDQILDIVMPKDGRLGLVKANIEGAEKALFGSGSMDEILRHTNVLLVETHDAYVADCSAAVAAAAERTNLRLWEQRGTLSCYITASQI